VCIAVIAVQRGAGYPRLTLAPGELEQLRAGALEGAPGGPHARRPQSAAVLGGGGGGGQAPRGAPGRGREAVPLLLLRWRGAVGLLLVLQAVAVKLLVAVGPAAPQGLQRGRGTPA